MSKKVNIGGLELELRPRGDFKVDVLYVCPDCHTSGQVEITTLPADQKVSCSCGRLLFSAGNLGPALQSVPDLVRDAFKGLLK